MLCLKDSRRHDDPSVQRWCDALEDALTLTALVLAAWKQGRFPFKVVDESQTATYARAYVHGHIITDTEANPSTVDFRQVADECDLLVIPAVPETTANDCYRVLLTKVPPKPRTDGEQLRAMLVQNDIARFIPICRP